MRDGNIALFEVFVTKAHREREGKLYDERIPNTNSFDKSHKNY